LKSKPNKNEEDEKMDYEKDHLEEEMSIEEQSISTTNFPQEYRFFKFF
jgi:hypothetical protein